MTNNLEIKVRLGEILHERKITQTELALKTGLRNATISKLVNNKYERITLSHISCIFQELELESFDQLFEIVEVKTENPDEIERVPCDGI